MVPISDCLLTASKLRDLIVYMPHIGMFFWRVRRSNMAAGSMAGYLGKQGYWHIAIDRKQYKAHRLAWLYMTGEWPLQQIDHINGIPDDNRFCNLRCATACENQRNKRRLKNSTSGRSGVSWHKKSKMWRAYINAPNHISLGYYHNKYDAISARQDAELTYFGEFTSFHAVTEADR